jgi:hypothetical protein
VEKGHGRLDVRQVNASTELVGYSTWPHLAQVVQITRTWQQRGRTRQAVRYLVTSLPPQVAGVERLLRLSRGHWQIENGLHYVKDVTLGEDRSLVHLGGGPAVLGLLRSTVVSLLHQVGQWQIAASMRRISRHPRLALVLLGLA